MAIDYDDPAIWGPDGLYDYTFGGAPPGTVRARVGYYGPALGYDGIVAIVDAAFGGAAARNKRIVLLGAGYGREVEQLIALGYSRTVAVETSAFIHATAGDTWQPDVEAALVAAGHDLADPYAVRSLALYDNTQTKGRVPLVDADVLTDVGRDAIVAALGGNPQVIATLSVMEGLTDVEGQAITDAMQAFNGPQTIIHALHTGDGGPAYDDRLNWKSLAEWGAAISGVDAWVDLSTGEIAA